MFQMEFWETLRPPEKGEEKKFARELEERFRKALGL